ncbi:MAG: hypothetical protein A2816_00030 [Candidatus Yanofskybacteria bacterium RIFCSPHIGHO2_01_FULL_39_44]|nr:MAG: hypothetical protein A2816_00030 [Candidatus Yanofskybacteria bacterium RIFCSPHIGHO2_01_FULL_39_44]
MVSGESDGKRPLFKSLGALYKRAFEPDVKENTQGAPTQVAVWLIADCCYAAGLTVAAQTELAPREGSPTTTPPEFRSV